jgi:hypothetical protein
MTYHGGPVQHSQKVFTIFWVPSGFSFPSGYQATINQFVQDLNGSSYYGIASQYNDQVGNINTTVLFGGTWLDTINPFPSSSLSNSDLFAEVSRAMAANGWTSDANSYFQVYVPNGIDEGASFCGYHVTSNPAVGLILFDCGSSPSGPYPHTQIIDAAIDVSAHEIMETVTDPQGNAWYNVNGAGEIGDLCVRNYGARASDGSNVSLNGHPYLIQQEWSNRDGGCVLSSGTTGCSSGTSSLRNIDGGPPIHPPGSLLKVATDPTVYLVDPDNRKRPITNASVLAQLYNQTTDARTSTNFSTWVVTVGQDELDLYEQGANISTALPSNGQQFPDGKLIGFNGEVSMVTGIGKRRPFASPSTLTGLGYSFCQVVNLSQSEYNAYLPGAPVDAMALLTSSVNLSPAGPYTVGQNISGTFTIRNVGFAAFPFSSLGIGGRLNGSTVSDISFVSTTVASGSSFTFSSQPKQLSTSGTYDFFAAYQEGNAHWAISVPANVGIVRSRQISVNTSGCTYNLSASSQSFGSSGGSGSFGVTTASGCAWTAVSNASWITTSSSGSGNGTVNFSVATNTSSARTGTISLGGQTFTVSQAAGGGGCPSTTISLGQTINASLTTSDCVFSGTTHYVDVYNFSGTAGQQIVVAMNSSVFDTYLYLLDASNQLIAQDDDGGGGTNSRIPATSGGFTLPATGSFTIYATSFSADATTGSTGAYSISLSTGTCSYALNANSQSFGSSGGSGSFGVTTSSGCSWTAVSNASWLTTNSSGSGNGTVNYSVAANTGSARTGAISVGGQTFTVSQASGGGGCPSTTISIGQTINGTLTTSDCIFSGTTRFVDVYTFSGTAGQQIVVGMNSSIFDTYLYLLDGNNQLLAQDDDGGGGTNSRIPSSGAFSLPATGTFTIYATSFSADGTTGSTGAYSISLSSGSCSYALSASSQSFGSSGGSGSFGVTTSSGCAWTAISNANWITTTSSGSGNGTVNFTVAANTGSARAGFITVNNQSFSVSQAAASINVTIQTNPAGRSFVVDGVNFATTQVLSWTAGSSHTISTTSPQSTGAGSQFLWNTWSDGGAISHSVTPTTATTYTANFTTQFMLTMSAGAGGTVSPASAFFNSGQSVNISATPNSGFTFTNWTGAGTGSFTGATNSASVTMNGPITETASFAAIQKTIQLSTSTYAINEGGGFVNITVTRSGDVSGMASVAFATSNGTAKEGKDYTAAFGLLNFAAGETTKTFPILIIDNAFIDGSRTVSIALSNPSGVTLGSQSTAVLTISDNDTSTGSNPIDQPRSFVEYHYFDFLGRYPDQSGWDFWTNNINGCTPQPSCLEVQRINTSAAYFLSIEFQQTGYLVYKIYKASFGNLTDIPNAPVPIKRQEFLPDTHEIGNGVIVNQGNWQQQLEANKQAFTLEFVQRARFTSGFPTTMTPAQFVDKLFSNAGVTPTATDRNAAIAEFGSATATGDVAARSRALRDVAENVTLNAQEFNKAFVLMQYFGYLRRNPYDSPEPTLDYSGFNFWLGKLNSFGGNYINAEMVKAFISSSEYRQRFGP